MIPKTNQANGGRVDRTKLAYLALEGGGGKGATFLGAIQALKTMKILPIDIENPGTSQIAGISGSSAGAITALLLGMGMTAQQLKAVLSRSSTFAGFFDGPAPGQYRLVNSRGESAVGGKPRIDRPSTARRALTMAAPLPMLALGAAASALLDALLGTLDSPMAEQVRRAPQAYLNNLLLDRGLFSGFAARTFFQSMMSRHLGRRLLAAAGRYPARVQPPEQIGFATFYELTGVDLVITGVNISKGIPAMFSRRLTPDFPVVDAVTIFMSLPILFKPAYVEAEVPVTAFNPDPQAYQGFWVDGGVLNNVPMYAFDDNFTAASKASTLAPLNPQVVGLRLTPGAPGQPPPPFADPASTGLGIFLKGMAETLLYPSEQGQLRTCAEIEQTIDLHTYDLQLTEFAPPPSQSAEPIANAERSVLGYFNPGLH